MKWFISYFLNPIILISLFIMYACEIMELPIENISSSDSAILPTKEGSYLTEISVIGEVREKADETLNFQLNNGRNLEIPYDSFPDDFNLGELKIADVIELKYLDYNIPTEGRIDKEIESYTFQYNIFEEKATSLLKKLSLEEKVGQMFLVRIPEKDKIETALHYEIGGYLWFGKDFSDKTMNTLPEAVRSIQESVKLNLFMAVDEEGGEVNRISSFSEFRTEAFPSPRQEFKDGGWDEIIKVETEKAKLLKELGFNLNLAPVADVANGEEDFIFNRSFSTSPLQVAKYVKLAVSIFNQNGVGTVLKHFPGYGSNVDTHTGVAYDQRDYDSFDTHDFIPFRAGIQAETEAILISHNVIITLDDQYPASLSRKVHDVLRDEMNFDGIIITDDLVMDGLKDFANQEEAAILAVLAGNDILISTEYSIQIPAVIEAVKSNEIPIDEINQSVQRVLETKIRLGIIE